MYPRYHRVLLSLILVATACAVGCRRAVPGNSGTISASGPVHVAVFQIVEHPAIDQLREGFQSALRAAPELRGRQVAFDYKNAQGDNTQINLIADKMVADQPALIFVMGTPCAQAVAKRTTTIPIVLGGATDPVSTGLVKSWDHPGRNVTGTSDLPPFERQFRLLRELLPNARRVGVLYNAGEANSVAAMKRVRSAATAVGVKLVERPAASTAEVPQAARSLVGRCDAIYVPTDNTVHSAINTVMNVAQENRLPVFNCLLDTVKKGALFSLSVDYKRLGELSGQMAAQIIGGKSPANMPIRIIERPEFSVNMSTAEHLGIRLPPNVLSEVQIVVRDGKVVKQEPSGGKK